MTIIKPQLHPLHTTSHDQPQLGRRLLLGGALGVAGGLLGCSGAASEPVRDGGYALTPQGCSAPQRLYGGSAPQIVPATASSGPEYAQPQAPQPSRCYATADNIEGPFFSPGAPERASLVTKATPGQRLTIAGRVLTTDCRVVPGVQLEFWQADHTGAYDNRGFGFRATLHSDAGGSYRLDTIVPGHYLNGARYRPAHIHVKLRAPGLRPLTTQLYLPDDPYNQGDPFIVESLIMPVKNTGGSRWASFDFVLPPA